MKTSRSFAGFSFCINAPQCAVVDQIAANFAGLRRPAASDRLFSIDLTAPAEHGASWQLTAADGTAKAVAEVDLLYEIEGIIVKAAQLAAAELIFLHAAALTYQSQGILLVGESGAGKSTLSWALCQHGLGYLSDELGPLDLRSGKIRVHPYPHAICLKDEPPPPYALPRQAFDTGVTWHIPTVAIPQVELIPAPVSALFFVRNEPDNEPSCRPVPAPQAAHRLYPQLLNALAHDNKGLAAAANIAQQLATFELISSDLTKTVELVINTLNEQRR